MTNETFQVGDRVTIVFYGYSRDGYKLTTVTEANKRFVALSDGSKWQPDGRCPYPKPKGRSTWSPRRYLAKTTQEHVDAIRKHNLVNRMQNVRWDELDLETLKAIAVLLPKKETD